MEPDQQTQPPPAEGDEAVQQPNTGGGQPAEGAPAEDTQADDTPTDDQTE